MKNLVTFVILAVLFLNPSRPAEGGVRSNASYLRLSPSARAAAMGGGFTALADDASALYYNPAGITYLERKELIINSATLGSDRSYLFLAYARSSEKKRESSEVSWFWGGEDNVSGKNKFLAPPSRKLNGFGVALISFGVSNIDAYDEYGNPEGSFSESENTLIAGLSTNLYENVSAGANLKAYMQSLRDGSATGAGLDIGILVHQPFSRFSAGLCLQNVIGNMKWNVREPALDYEYGYSETVAANIKLGMAYALKNITLLLDLDSSAGNALQYHAGMEYRLGNTAFLRAGLDTNDITAGIGFKAGDVFSIDYSYLADTDNFSNLQRITIVARLDPPKPIKHSKKKN